MKKKDMFQMLETVRRKDELQLLEEMNQKTRRFGLSLTLQEQQELAKCRDKSLKKYNRVEFGTGILDKLIFTFCDSQYVEPQNYLACLQRLQDIFYEFRNESLDLMTDDEVLTFMEEQFETVCAGSLDYLEETCLPIFTAAVRAGYRGYEESGGRGEYTKFDQVKRWDREAYLQALQELG